MFSGNAAGRAGPAVHPSCSPRVSTQRAGGLRSMASGQVLSSGRLAGWQGPPSTAGPASGSCTLPAGLPAARLCWADCGLLSPTAGPGAPGRLHVPRGCSRMAPVRAPRACPSPSHSLTVFASLLAACGPARVPFTTLHGESPILLVICLLLNFPLQ